MITREQLLVLHDSTCNVAKSIMVDKNTDYGADDDALRNFRLCANMGIPIDVGILTRLGDKLARIGKIVTSGQVAVKAETVEDTIFDAINYLVILRAALIEAKQNEGSKNAMS